MQTQTRVDTKRLAILAVMSAIAYLLAAVFSFFPGLVGFLRYDPKDIVITIGGFIYGPLASLAMSLVVSFIEMFTVSKEGPIGFVMNVVASTSFACVAALIYKKWHSMTGAVVGLLAGCASMTTMMIVWNYFITPIYMGLPRAEVAAMLVPMFLPFNLIKSGLNAGITLLLYKPLVTALRKAKLIPPSQAGEGAQVKKGYIILAAVLLATCVLAAWGFIVGG